MAKRRGIRIVTGTDWPGDSASLNSSRLFSTSKLRPDHYFRSTRLLSVESQKNSKYIPETLLRRGIPR